MVYKATTSFCGLVGMVKGEVREINNPEIERDLLNCGYIVAVEQPKKEMRKTKKTTKGV